MPGLSRDTQDLGLCCGMRDLFSCGMQDLVPRPGIKPRPPALGVQSLSRWTSREAPAYFCLFVYSSKQEGFPMAGVGGENNQEFLPVN